MTHSIRMAALNGDVSVYLHATGMMVLLGLFKLVNSMEMLTSPEVKIVDQNTNITLECEFHSDEFNLFDNPVLWKKYQRGEETDINLMSNMYNPYAKTNRFIATYHPTRPKFKLNLTIYKVSPEDSGNYTCEVRGPKSQVLAKVTHLVFVRANVETLGITDTNTSTVPQHKRSITFTEGTNNKLRCVSTGGYPPPEMRIYIGSIDISHELEWYQFPKLKGRKGLRLMTYYSERWSYNFNAKPQYDGQELTCAVDVPGYGRNNTMSILHVEYSPYIRCYDTPAKVGDTQAQLPCDIWAKPRITSSYWVIDENGTTVSVPFVVNEYWTIVQDQTNGAIRNSLFIRSVRKGSFRKYTLIAENKVGVSTHAVELTEKIIPTITTRTGMRRKTGRTIDEIKRKSYYIHTPRNQASILYTHKLCLISNFIIIVINIVFYYNSIASMFCT